MKSWYDIYKDRMNERYHKHIRTKYAGLIDQIVHNPIVQNQPSLLIGEFGCGAANISRVLSEHFKKSNAHYVLVDNCAKMLSLAMENMKGTNSLFLNEDIVNPKFDHEIFLHDYWPYVFDIIHSHGVLEHFSDRDINRIIRKQKEICKGPLIHYVPSYRYEVPSRGDERLLTPAQWHEICKPDKIIELNNGFDLILYWEGTYEQMPGM